MLLVNSILDESELVCADLNYDNIINILDVVLIVNIILGEGDLIDVADINHDGFPFDSKAMICILIELLWHFDSALILPIWACLESRNLTESSVASDTDILTLPDFVGPCHTNSGTQIRSSRM